MKLNSNWRVRLRPDPFILLLLTSVPLAAQTNAPPPVPAVTPSTERQFSTNTDNFPVHTGKISDVPPVVAATNFGEVAAPSASAPVTPTLVDPFNDPLIKKVQARHEKAVRGDTKETKALTVDLEKWTKEQPKNYLLLAYLGSAYTLDSRDAWPGPGKLTYLKNGGKNLDAAVAGEPDNPAVRFIRAIDYYELPTLLGKRQISRDDFKILLKQIDGTTPTAYALNVETQQAICYYAGICATQMNQTADAKTAWLLGYKLGPTTDLGKKIGDELMKLK